MTVDNWATIAKVLALIPFIIQIKGNIKYNWSSIFLKDI